MKNLLIVVICAAVASMVVTVILKYFGFEVPMWIGGGVGGAVAAFVSIKLYGKKQG